MDFIYDYTEDGLYLSACHWESKSKDVCVLCIHGMSGNILENHFAHKLGEVLSENNVGFIYGHNRGYCHINDIKTNIKKKGGYEFKRIGARYELFEESVYDVDLWLKHANEYKKIIIMGHSLGAPKVIHHFWKQKPSSVSGVVLLSPVNMIGLVKLEKYQKDYAGSLSEAESLVNAGKPRQILSRKIWDWYNVSAQTFLSLFTEKSAVDVLPILRNPNEWEQFSSINVPIYLLFGEHNDVAIRSLEEDAALIKSKATNCPSFTTCILEGADHCYVDRENELAQTVLAWVKNGR